MWSDTMQREIERMTYREEKAERERECMYVCLHVCVREIQGRRQREGEYVCVRERRRIREEGEKNKYSTMSACVFGGNKL